MARRYTLSEIKTSNASHGGHFFDKDVMKFFAASNWPTSTARTGYKTRYDKETGTNYAIVTDPWGKP